MTLWIDVNFTFSSLFVDCKWYNNCAIKNLTKSFITKNSWILILIAKPIRQKLHLCRSLSSRLGPRVLHQVYVKEDVLRQCEVIRTQKGRTIYLDWQTYTFLNWVFYSVTALQFHSVPSLCRGVSFLLLASLILFFTSPFSLRLITNFLFFYTQSFWLIWLYRFCSLTCN